MSDPRSSDPEQPPSTLVWDWPLRIWHWVFAISVSASLVTGLMGDIALMDWHMRLGYLALGLLLFRIGWGIWGGRYARFGSFRTSPRRFVAHFRGEGRQAPHTAPGVVLVVLLLAAVAAQAVAGLYTTDEIFTEGPLVRGADDDTVNLMTALHHRLFWVVLGLISVHLTAHVVYALRRDPTPLAMFTGRKRLHAVPTRNLLVRGLVTAAAAAAAVWWVLISI